MRGLSLLMSSRVLRSDIRDQTKAVTLSYKLRAWWRSSAQRYELKNHNVEMETDNLLAATDTSLKNRCRLVNDVLITISG